MTPEAAWREWNFRFNSRKDWFLSAICGVGEVGEMKRAERWVDPRMTPEQIAAQQALTQEGTARHRRANRLEILIASGFLTGVLAIGAYVWLTEQLGASVDVNAQDTQPSVTAPAPAEVVEVYTATPTDIPPTLTPRPPTETLVFTATATPSPTGIDTATATAEFTPTPEPIESRYPSCTRGLYVGDQLTTPRKAVTREDDGSKLPTGLSWNVGNYSNTYYDATAVYSCIDNIDAVVDPIFGDGAITMDIVFYDVYGNEHRYPARTNGYTYNNKPVYLLPFQLNSESGWQDSTVGNVRKKISDKNGAQAETVLETADRTQDLWVVSELINLHREFLDLLIKAVSTGRDFPKPPEDGFRIQVLALAIY